MIMTSGYYYKTFVCVILHSENQDIITPFDRTIHLMGKIKILKKERQSSL